MKHVLVCLIFSLFFIIPPVYAEDPYAKDLQQAIKKTKYHQQHWSNQLDWELLHSMAKQRNIPLHNLAGTGSSIGHPGDILVTLDGTIGTPLLTWAGGHAGTVSDIPGYVVEAFGNKGDRNGVRHWVNNWKTRYKQVKGLWVKGALARHYDYSASYHRKQVGKSYNYNFFNIYTTQKFYCSQLIWRSWYNQGWNLNDGFAVWPVDLIESPLTVPFYSQG